MTVFPPPPLSESIDEFTNAFCNLIRRYRELTSYDSTEDEWFEELCGMLEHPEFSQEIINGIESIKRKPPYHAMVMKVLLLEIGAVTKRINNILEPQDNSVIAKLVEGIRNGRTVIKSLKDVLKGIVPEWVMLALTVFDEGVEVLFGN